MEPLNAEKNGGAKPYKMKGHTLPGINQKLDDHPKNVDELGLSGGSALQHDIDGEKHLNPGDSDFVEGKHLHLTEDGEAIEHGDVPGDAGQMPAPTDGELGGTPGIMPGGPLTGGPGGPMPGGPRFNKK